MSKRERKFGRWTLPILAGACVAIALVFHLALRGYGMLGNCFLGLAGVLLAYWGLGFLKVRHERLATVLNKILTYTLIVGILLFTITEVCIIREALDAKGKGDTVIILGAGVNGTVPSRTLQARLAKALEYAEENPNAVFVLSGGQGPGEDISEAECMRRWLTSRGVPEERLLLEDRSTSTQENVRFSRKLLLERDPDYDGKVLLITEYYHVMRAKLMALDEGFTNVSARGAYTGLPVLAANYYIREAAAIWYYALFK